MTIDRRDFVLATGSALLLSAMPLHALAQGGPREGKEYLKLDKPAATEAPAGKVEVVEFFWYSCGHCNAFEPQLEAWVKNLPKDVAFRRVPIAFQPSFVPQQKLFYALQATNQVETMHRRVFHAIHTERKPLATDAAILEWVKQQPGVEVAKFQEAFSSFGATTQANKATQLQNAYKVEGVPALGVAGRWYTDGTLAGSMQRALATVEFLVAQARTGKA